VGLTFSCEEYIAPQIASGALVRALDDWSPPFAGCFLYRRQIVFSAPSAGNT
jgi:hypothetical protein